ncbi:MAG TPA: carboxypeptidase-like regulatory domain-containing protein [Pyrinomonadaceae bacterium]|nr:carboxypeptidase-like regulatory domain-containing protein [Pyrinomonadaceae bacterium]
MAFCLADGTPLVRVIPNTQSWTKGKQVLGEAEKLLRKQKRRLKWKRVLSRAISTLVITTVVCVVAANSIIYLKPRTEDKSVSNPLARADGLTRPDDSTAVGLASDPASLTSPTPTPTPTPRETKLTLTPTPTPTPSPTPSPTAATSVYKISGRVMSKAGPLRHIKVSLEGSMATSAMTDTNGYYAFANLRAGGSYTITPRELRLTPRHRFFDNLRRDESGDFFQSDATPTPTPTLGPTPRVTETWTPSPSPEIKENKPECSEEDKSRERQRILQTVGPSLRKNTQGEIQVEISLVGGCKNAAVRVRYSETRDNTYRPGVTTERKEKRLACRKFLGQWICTQI